MNGRLRPSPLAPASRPTASAASLAGCAGAEQCSANSPLAPQAGEGNLVALRAKFGWEAA